MSVAALLDPAEGQLGSDLHVGVDPDVAGLDVANHAVHASQIPGPHARGQAVAAVVGDGDRLVVGVERDDHCDGPEDLLAADPQRVVLGHEQGGFHPVAARRVRGELRAVAAAEDQIGFLAADLEVVDHPVVLLLGDQRTHLRRRVQRIADHDRFGDPLDALEHLVEHGSLHEDARPGRTGLAGVERVHRRDGDAERGRVEVGIGEHDVRRLAPELEDARREGVRRRALDQLGRPRRTRHRDLLDGSMANHRVPDVTEAGDHVQNAGREHIGQQFGEAQDPHAGLLRRLDHDGVAGRQGQRQP